jgi:hypothetical protein
MMKKILLLTLAFLLFSTYSFSADFSNFDDEYCIESNNIEYCMEFQWLPFGASGIMFYNVTLHWSGYWQSIPVNDFTDLGQVSSIDGKRFEFLNVPFIGIFNYNGLELFQTFETLERK